VNNNNCSVIPFAAERLTPRRLLAPEGQEHKVLNKTPLFYKNRVCHTNLANIMATSLPLPLNVDTRPFRNDPNKTMAA
jgi:hypothetical protein